MSLYIVITLSLFIFLGGLTLAVLSFYFGYRLSDNYSSNRFRGKIIYRTRRKGKYILNNFTARIFFMEHNRSKRITIVNGYSPLTTEKYSFTKTKLFDN